MSGLATVEKAFELYSEVEKENECLKAEIKVLHTECDTCWKIEELRNENERLKGELQQSATNCNKLRCLALHAMSEYFYLKAETYTDIEAGKYVKVMMWATKSREAYCKAKKELMEDCK